MSRREIAPAVPATLDARRAVPADVLERACASVDLDSMLDAMSGRLDNAGQVAFRAEAAASRQQVAALAARFADDDTYRPLFEWLLDITLRRPVSVWGLGDGRFEYVDRREGANSVAWQFLQAVAEGRGEQHPNREGVDP